MIAIKKNSDMPYGELPNCHDGIGTLLCKSMLEGYDSDKFPFMHHDIIPKGVSIGVHLHEDDDEIYYMIRGKGILTFEGAEYEMAPGDISMVKIGQSHGFLATEDTEMIVVAAYKR